MQTHISGSSVTQKKVEVATLQYGSSLIRRGLDAILPAVCDGEFSHEGVPNIVYACSFSVNGETLATASTDKMARLFEVTTGHQVRVFDGRKAGLSACGFSPDGRWLATGSFGGVAALVDTTTGQESRILEGHTKAVLTCCFSSDGEWLCTGSADGSARVWHVETGLAVRVFEAHSQRVFACSLSSNAHWLTTRAFDGRCRLWNVFKEEEHLCFETGDRARDAEPIPNTTWIGGYSADGGFFAAAMGMGQIIVKNVAQSENSLKLFEGRAELPVALQFSLDKQMIAIGTLGGMAVLWNIVSGRRIRSWAMDESGWATWDENGMWDGDGDVIQHVLTRDPVTIAPRGLPSTERVNWQARRMSLAELPQLRAPR